MVHRWIAILKVILQRRNSVIIARCLLLNTQLTLISWKWSNKCVMGLQKMVQKPLEKIKLIILSSWWDRDYLLFQITTKKNINWETFSVNLILMEVEHSVNLSLKACWEVLVLLLMRLKLGLQWDNLTPMETAFWNSKNSQTSSLSTHIRINCEKWIKQKKTLNKV